MSGLDAIEMDALEDLPRDVRKGIRFLPPDVIRVVLQHYSSGVAATPPPTAISAVTAAVPSTPTQSNLLTTTPEVHVHNSIQELAPTSSISRTLISDNPEISALEVPDWTKLNSVQMAKRAITIHAQIMGMEHLQEVFSGLDSNVRSRDLHKHDSLYNRRRSAIRQVLHKLPDYQDAWTFKKYSDSAQSRLVEGVQQFAASQGWTWSSNQRLVRALIMTMCTGASSTAKRRVKVEESIDRELKTRKLSTSKIHSNES